MRNKPMNPLRFLVFMVLGVQWAAVYFLAREWPFWPLVLAQAAILALTWRLGGLRVRLGILSLKDVGMALLFALAAFVAAGLVYALQARLGINAGETAAFSVTGWHWAIMVMYAVILTPVLEEWLFRGLLLDRLRVRWPHMPMLVISIQAGAFAVYHVSIAQLVPTLVLGLFLGWLRIRQGNLWATIIAHAAYNGLGMVLVLLQPMGNG